MSKYDGGGSHNDLWSGFTTSEMGALTGTYRRCHEDHKPVSVLNGTLYGGACGHPKKGYDVYIGLDKFSIKQVCPKDYPWNPKKSGPVHVEFPISDMCAPRDVKNFKKMVTWVCKYLQDGQKVHVGCIGGHGRTGLLMAAIVSEAMGLDDPIRWVRENHCKKAVESDSQIKFLVKHYKAKTATATKNSFGGVAYKESGTRFRQPSKKSLGRGINTMADRFEECGTVSPAPTKSSVW